MAKCNPFGYASDAGPKHLMGGRYGPEYAGEKMLVEQSGLHGLGFCQQGPGRGPADSEGRWRMVCANGHASGIVMDLCRYHVVWIAGHYCGTCTRCAIPEQSIQLERDMNDVMRAFSAAAGDYAAQGRLRVRLDDLRHEMDELVARGVILPRVPLQLVEVS